MKRLLGIPLCFLLLVACGSDNDDDDDTAAQQEQPAPEEDSGETNFTKRCRLAKEIEGSNYQYQWSDLTTGDRLQFDTSKNKVRVASTGNNSVSPAASYEVKKPAEGRVGSLGSINYDGVSLFFPVIPPGTIQGESGSYIIGSLTRNSDKLGTYLCSPSLANEFTSPSSSSRRILR